MRHAEQAMMGVLRDVMRRVPVLGPIARRVYRALLGRRPVDAQISSAAYWEQRYTTGGNSGVGSSGRFAEFKAEEINRFVASHEVRTVIDLGCGDGNQLRLALYPEYLGFDVSAAAISRCRQAFHSDPHKSFHLMSEYVDQTADLALSLDVIYHLIEDEVFERYMRTLFAAGMRYVIIYASDSDDRQPGQGAHVRHRKFTRWIEQHQSGWRLMGRVPNRYPFHGDCTKGSFAEFFFYEKSVVV